MEQQKLTPKQRRFIEEYLIDPNATQAAIRAGYSKKTAYSAGQRLLKNVEVAAVLNKAQKERSERTGITADSILRNLGDMNSVKLNDIVEWNSNGIVKVKSSDELTPQQAACIQEIRLTSTEKGFTFRLKLYDRIKLLELAGKHVGVQAFKDKVEVDTGDAIIARLLEGRKRVADAKAARDLKDKTDG